MDRRGGCCIARYGGGGGGAAVYDVSKIDQIMLRFRPIAPKPAASGETTKPPAEVQKTSRNGRGRKRRSSTNSKSSSSKSSSSSGEGSNKRCKKTVVTLSLLPETPDLTPKKAPVMLSFDGSAVTWPARENSVVGSWVIVERVTDTWGVQDEPAMSDEEKKRTIQEDTCPGFVSDCWSRVWWTNKAYKEMAKAKETETTSVAVWLVMKEKLPVNCDGFTCRVTVQSTCDNVSSRATLPCDVWRLSDGGFAWKLDVQAALSLGR